MALSITYPYSALQLSTTYMTIFKAATSVDLNVEPQVPPLVFLFLEPVVHMHDGALVWVRKVDHQLLVLSWGKPTNAP
jgi:hypothetical protein